MRLNRPTLDRFFMRSLCRIAKIGMELICVRSPLFGRRQYGLKRQEAMLDAIFIILAIGIFAAACGYAALCERM